MKDGGIFDAVSPVIRCFEAAGIDYCIGGSVAAGLHGYARATMDIDLMVDLKTEHVETLIDALQSDYYISETMIRESLRSRKCFNVMLLDTMFKVDVFLPKNREFDRSAFERRQRKSLYGTTNEIEVWVTSVEDMVLFKLEWYEKGNRISERQWLDVQQILRTQKDHVDLEYIIHWAEQLKLSELAKEALSEAEIR